MTPGTELSPLTLAGLAEAVRGPVLLPGDPRLAAEVAGFNVATLHRPAVVVGATCAADVALAVRFAAAAGLPVGVQATGHGAVVPADGALLVTTARMQGCRVDPVARTATVGAGARWSSVVEAAAPHGLAPLLMSSSDVGVVGSTVGGGAGLFGRAHGSAADHVRAVRLVTADGSLREVDADREPDLFWGVRGAGGSLGIVTDMVIGLVPLDRFTGGGLHVAGEHTPAVLHAWRRWAPRLPETASTSVALLRLPALPYVPEPLRGRLTVHVRFAHLGDDVEAKRLLAPMREVAPALLDTVTERSVVETDAVHGEPTDPMPFWDRGTLLRALPAAAVDRLLATAGPGRDVPLVMVELRLLGGALSRPAEPENAVAGRDGAFALRVLGVAAPGVTASVVAAGSSVLAAAEPWETGSALVTLLGARVSPAEVAAAYPPAVAARLAALKRRHDPANLFRVGHTVSPATVAAAAPPGGRVPRQAGRLER